MLGVAAAAGALYAVPVVDQQREVSYVSVAPNGGNLESFHINIPVDRVMVGTPGHKSGLPAGMEWPQDEILSAFGAEMFKVRNARDVVVGIAARAVAKETNGDIIGWVVHLPARGTLFVDMDAAIQDDGHRIGRLRAGTQEFESLTGIVSERWVSDTSGDEDAPDGRIELHATYVGEAEPVE